MFGRKKYRVLDWVSRHDPRSRAYGIRQALPERVDRRPTSWNTGTVLDQGREGACVGFGWTAELLAHPKPPTSQPSQSIGNIIATSYYREAKKIDSWPGEDYEGTSVIAGAKVIQSKGFIRDYRWAFSTDDLIDSVIINGPVVIGIPWYQKMYQTRPSGLVEVGGRLIGGHCLTITGYHPSLMIEGKNREVFRWINSWGKSYGLDGSGFIQVGDLEHLLKQGGEACVPMGRSTPVFSVKSKRFLRFF